MALIQCPNCGNMMSDKALACPKCGFKNEPNVQESVADSVNQIEPQNMTEPSSDIQSTPESSDVVINNSSSPNTASGITISKSNLMMGGIAFVAIVVMVFALARASAYKKVINQISNESSVTEETEITNDLMVADSNDDVETIDTTNKPSRSQQFKDAMADLNAQKEELKGTSENNDSSVDLSSKEVSEDNNQEADVTDSTDVESDTELDEVNSDLTPTVTATIDDVEVTFDHRKGNNLYFNLINNSSNTLHFVVSRTFYLDGIAVQPYSIRFTNDLPSGRGTQIEVWFSSAAMAGYKDKDINNIIISISLDNENTYNEVEFNNIGNL